MKHLLILVFFILTVTLVAKAEDASDRVKEGSTSIGVFFDGGIGSTFSSSVQYFATQGLFLKGGVSTFQSSITSNGVSEDIKSTVFDIGFGEAMAINKYTVASLTATYEYYYYDKSSGGTSFSGSENFSGLGLGAYVEFFVNPRSSFGLGLAYRSFSGTYRDTNSTFSGNTTGLTTGWKFYF
jgi:hypothetical protein